VLGLTCAWLALLIPRCGDGRARAVLPNGGPLAVPVVHLAVWTAVLAVIPSVLAVRRWQSAR
jgi:hypothetical protein